MRRRPPKKSSPRRRRRTCGGRGDEGVATATVAWSIISAVFRFVFITDVYIRSWVYNVLFVVANKGTRSNVSGDAWVRDAGHRMGAKLTS